MPKHTLRAQMIAMRHSLTAAEQLEAGMIIQKCICATPEYGAASSVALYAATHGEVPTKALINMALVTEKRVILPAVTGDELVFREICSESDFVTGLFGIPEPSSTCKRWQPADIDLFVIPGVAFDSDGRRLGYGKGYYDRALHLLEGSGRLIGICYDFQLVEKISHEPHDVIMDKVITERRSLPPVLI